MLRPKSYKLIGVSQLLIVFNALFFINNTNFNSLLYYPDNIRHSLFFFKNINFQPNDLALLILATNLSLIFYILGIGYRFCIWIALISSSVLIGYRYNFSFYHWADSIIPLSLFGLCIAPLSIPKLFSQKRIETKVIEFHLMVMRFIFIWPFFSAGLSKLRNSGIAWLDQSNQLLMLSINRTLFKTWAASGVTDLVERVLEMSWLLQVGATFVLIIELISPLALFLVNLRLPLWVGLYCLLCMFSLLLGHQFIYFFWPFLFYGFEFNKK